MNYFYNIAFSADLFERGIDVYRVPKYDQIDDQLDRAEGVKSRLRQFEDENAKLKRLVADLSLDKAMLQDEAV